MKTSFNGCSHSAPGSRGRGSARDDPLLARGRAPDMALLARIDRMGVIATAPAHDPREADFVSRFSAPGIGIPEDPVTGSAHCTLIPYWARRLGKKTLRARQVSARGGDLFCEDAGDRVKIGGRAVLYLEGKIEM